MFKKTRIGSQSSLLKRKSKKCLKDLSRVIDRIRSLPLLILCSKNFGTTHKMFVFCLQLEVKWAKEI